MKKGWQTTALGQVCELISGQHIEARDYNTESRGVGYLTGPSDFGPMNPIITKWTEYPKVRATSGDILITVKGAGVGKINLLDQADVAISRQLMAVRVANADSRFVYAFLTSAFDQLQAFATGATIPGISRDQILGLKVALPPLSEQQRLVGVLDEALAGLATAQANAEKNLQNARALFEGHLQSVFSQRANGWLDSTIGAEIKFIDYRGKTPTKTTSGVRLITAKNVRMGYLQESPMEFIASGDYKGWMTRGIPRKGDVLFTTEAPLANVAQLDTDERVAFAQRVIVMQANAAKLDSAFLKYLLLSQPVQKRIRTQGTGATVQGIKASLLKLLAISFPKALDEQRRIVAKLDELSAETERLEGIYQQKLTALAALKKALLHQVFTGQL